MSTTDWEAEFDDKFIGNEVLDLLRPTRPQELRDFIREHIKRAEERGRNEAITKCCVGTSGHCPVCVGDVARTPNEATEARGEEKRYGDKKCCGECFLPERDGAHFHTEAAGYFLPEDCKEEECPCHA